MYPDRPETPLPPSANQGELEGNYYNKGYGKLEIRQESQKGASEGILMGYLPDSTWQAHIRLQHVSADYWFGILDVLQNPDQFFQHACKAKVNVSIDGKPLSLDLNIGETKLAGLDVGTISFERAH